MNSEERYQNDIEKNGRETRKNYFKEKSDKRSLIGIVFIVIGAVLIAKKMDIIPSNISHIILSWQMLLIGIGVVSILVKENYRSGIILISLGTFFILPKVFDIPYDVRDMFWPVIFVVIGIVMLTVKNRHRKLGGNEFSEHEIDMLTLFGGGNRKITSDQFLGGKVTSIFGGSEIDLTGASLKEENCVIDAFTMFGGLEIAVPRDWEVQVDVVSIFGGFNDKRGPMDISVDNSKKVLLVKGFAIFGGGELKSY